MTKSLIISGFAGVGKSALAQKYPNIIDLESSDFKWIYKNNIIKEMNKEKRKGITERTQNPLWPLNYIKEIMTKATKYDIVLISQSENVRDCLKENGCEYFVCFPTKQCKREFIDRYIARGNNEAFISKISTNFDNWIDDLEAEERKIKIQSGEYLEDVLIRYGMI